jgi:hypothetical protein
MKYFDLEFSSQKRQDEVRREVLAVWTAQLAANGYSLTSQSDIGVTYSRRYRRWYIILLAVCLFPIGLLFLLATDEATITATVDNDDASGATVLLINGWAPKNVRRGLEGLEM